MDKIYELNDKTKLIIYSHDHSVYTFSLPTRHNTAPMPVAGDYESMLHSCIYDSTVYYIYKNTSQNIVLSNLLFNNPHTVFSDEAGLYTPVIHGFFNLEEKLLNAAVSIKNPLNSGYILEIWEVRPDFRRMPLPTNFPTVPSVEVSEFEDGLFIFEQSGQLGQVLQISKKALADLFFSSNEEVIQRPDIYRLLALSQSCGMRPETHSCPNCQKNEETIRSLTRQYNELAQTARQIQSEGKQWKDRYLAAIKNKKNRD